jgi:long-chain acyl-CoA synthetase
MGRQTVLDAFLKHADERPDATAALVKQKGAFAPVTWGQMRTRAERISAALIRWGIQPGDRVAIMMATSLDWTLVDLGVVGAGAISVPIYTSNLADECHFIMADSGAKLVFCDESKNSRKFFADGEGHASLRHVVQIDGALDLSLGQAPPAALAPGAMPPATPGVGYTSLTDFCAHVAVDTATLEHRRQEIPPDV